MAPASLLSMPSELRVKIFQHLVVTDVDIEWPSATRANGLHPAILQTCKQFYAEAAPLLYGDNSFSFDHPSDCNIFARLKDRHHAHLIRCVLFRVKDRDLRLWIEWLSSSDMYRSLVHDLPNLERLMIFYRHAAFWQTDRPHHEQFRTWTTNKRLEHVCLALENHHKNKADKPLDKTVVMIVGVSQTIFDALQTHFVRPHGRVAAGSEVELHQIAHGILRTAPFRCYDTHTHLELVGP